MLRTPVFEKARHPSVGYVNSPRSLIGMKVAGKLLSQHADLKRLQVDDAGWVLDNDECDLIFAHNTLRIERRLRSKTIVFCLLSVIERLRQDRNLLEDYLECPASYFWAHTRSGYDELRRLGFKNVRQLYRPGVLIFPTEYSPILPTRDVLWYYKADHQVMARYLPAAIDTMLRMPDVNFWLFPDAAAPIDAPNIKALGRINMMEVVPRMRGMVRYTAPMDIGRSTFDVLAQGRWVVYNWPTSEDEIFCEPDISKMEALIQRLLEEQNNYECVRRFQRCAATMNLQPLAAAWGYMLDEALRDRLAVPS